MALGFAEVKEPVRNPYEGKLEEQIKIFDFYAIEKSPSDFKDDPGFIYVSPADGKISEVDPKLSAYACRPEFANELIQRLDYIIRKIPQTGLATANLKKKKAQFLEFYIPKEGFGDEIRIKTQNDLDAVKEIVKEMVAVVDDLDR